MRLYLAGPLFSEAERAWLDELASRLRAEGFDCFVPHEHFPEPADVNVAPVYPVDTTGLTSADARIAWHARPRWSHGSTGPASTTARPARSGCSPSSCEETASSIAASLQSRPTSGSSGGDSGT